ncbi:hypothetical protein [Kumtagia ephedrae]|jgi:hypothetical protein|nr:hypothetical protein [Mesorhizobium ephedrae]
MRYVIGICILTGLIIWDGARYDGRYLAQVMKTVDAMVKSVTG